MLQTALELICVQSPQEIGGQCQHIAHKDQLVSFYPSEQGEGIPFLWLMTRTGSLYYHTPNPFPVSHMTLEYGFLKMITTTGRSNKKNTFDLSESHQHTLYG